MLEKQFEAMFCLVPTVDTSSNYQNGMPRDKARIMAALIVQEKIVKFASDSDEEVALMLREAIEQFKREATKARQDVKSTPANVQNTRNSVKTLENTVTVTCLAFY
jgi:cytochrome c556